MSKAIFFDLDDTLLSLRLFSLERLRVVAQTVNRDHSHIPFESFYQTLIKYYDQGYRSDLLNRALKEFSLFTKQYLMALVDIYRSVESNASLYDDSLPILQILSRKNTFLFLLTDGKPETQRIKVKAVDLEKFFDKIIFTGEFEEQLRKPSARLFIDT